MQRLKFNQRALKIIILFSLSFFVIALMSAHTDAYLSEYKEIKTSIEIGVWEERENVKKESKETSSEDKGE